MDVSDMTQEQKAARIKEIENHMEWMLSNLHGCDWCCGGGDEEWDELQVELDTLQEEN